MPLLRSAPGWLTQFDSGVSLNRPPQTLMSRSVIADTTRAVWLEMGWSHGAAPTAHAGPDCGVATASRNPVARSHPEGPSEAWYDGCPGGPRRQSNSGASNPGSARSSHRERKLFPTRGRSSLHSRQGPPQPLPPSMPAPGAGTAHRGRGPIAANAGADEGTTAVHLASRQLLGRVDHERELSVALSPGGRCRKQLTLSGRPDHPLDLADRTRARP